MPPSFTCLGVGNGLPFCGNKVDVSGYDYWVTLGGTLKGNSPTDQEIADSLRRVVKIFWTLDTFEAEADYDGTTVTDAQLWDASGTQYEAKKRVCESGEDDDPMRRSNQLTPGGASADVIAVAVNIVPVRMYDGGTDDESNFVGWGLAPANISVPTPPEVYTLDPFSVVAFQEYANEAILAYVSYADDPGSPWVVDDLASLSGDGDNFPLVELALDFTIEPSNLSTVSVTGLSFL